MTKEFSVNNFLEKEALEHRRNEVLRQLEIGNFFELAASEDPTALKLLAYEAFLYRVGKEEGKEEEIATLMEELDGIRQSLNTDSADNEKQKQPEQSEQVLGRMRKRKKRERKKKKTGKTPAESFFKKTDKFLSEHFPNHPELRSLEAVVAFADNRFEGLLSVTEARLMLMYSLGEHEDVKRVLRNEVSDVLMELPQDMQDQIDFLFSIENIHRDLTFFYLTRILDGLTFIRWLDVASPTEVADFCKQLGDIQRVIRGGDLKETVLDVGVRALQAELQSCTTDIDCKKERIKNHIVTGLKEFVSIIYANIYRNVDLATDGEEYETSVEIKDVSALACSFFIPSFVIGGLKREALVVLGGSGEQALFFASVNGYVNKVIRRFGFTMFQTELKRINKRFTEGEGATDSFQGTYDEYMGEYRENIFSREIDKAILNAWMYHIVSSVLGNITGKFTESVYNQLLKETNSSASRGILLSIPFAVLEIPANLQHLTFIRGRGALRRSFSSNFPARLGRGPFPLVQQSYERIASMSESSAQATIRGIVSKLELTDESARLFSDEEINKHRERITRVMRDVTYRNLDEENANQIFSRMINSEEAWLELSSVNEEIEATRLALLDESGNLMPERLLGFRVFSRAISEDEVGDPLLSSLSVSIQQFRNGLRILAEKGLLTSELRKLQKIKKGKRSGDPLSKIEDVLKRAHLSELAINMVKSFVDKKDIEQGVGAVKGLIADQWIQEYQKWVGNTTTLGKPTPVSVEDLLNVLALEEQIDENLAFVQNTVRAKRALLARWLDGLSIYIPDKFKDGWVDGKEPDVIREMVTAMKKEGASSYPVFNFNRNRDEIFYVELRNDDGWRDFVKELQSIVEERRKKGTRKRRPRRARNVLEGDEYE